MLAKKNFFAQKINLRGLFSFRFCTGNGCDAECDWPALLSACHCRNFISYVTTSEIISKLLFNFHRINRQHAQSIFIGRLTIWQIGNKTFKLASLCL